MSHTSYSFCKWLQLLLLLLLVLPLSLLPLFFNVRDLVLVVTINIHPFIHPSISPSIHGCRRMRRTIQNQLLLSNDLRAHQQYRILKVYDISSQKFLHKDLIQLKNLNGYNQFLSQDMLLSIGKKVSVFFVNNKCIWKYQNSLASEDLIQFNIFVNFVNFLF